MPLKPNFVRISPFFLESDVLGLHPDITIRGEQLYDRAIGASHKLTTVGTRLIYRISKGTLYRELEQEAKQNNVSSAQLQELLGFLNYTGSLKRSRAHRVLSKSFSIQSLHLLMGIRYSSVTWRRDVFVLTICLGVLRATLPVLYAALCVILLASVSGFMPKDRIAEAMGILIVFVASIGSHEYVHAQVARLAGHKVRILQRGMHLGVVHAKLGRRNEIQSSFSGPLVGTVICLLVASAAYMYHLMLLGIGSGVIALLHLLSLLPWYGDGASLFKAIQKKE